VRYEAKTGFKKRENDLVSWVQIRFNPLKSSLFKPKNEALLLSEENNTPTKEKCLKTKDLSTS
jgi:hypothetical protein